LRSATAVNLPAFAALGLKNNKSPRNMSDHEGWNGADYVFAFGSSYANPLGYREIPCIWSHLSERGLSLNLERTIRPHSKYDLVLCVCE
jgi:hypothetical protein